VTDPFAEAAYNSGMNRELNRETHAFSHSGSDYSIYTFMTPDGTLCYRFWRKVDEGQAKPGEGRADLVQRLKRQLDRLRYKVATLFEFRLLFPARRSSSLNKARPTRTEEHQTDAILDGRPWFPVRFVTSANAGTRRSPCA